MKIFIKNLAGPKSREWGNEAIYGYDGYSWTLIPHESGQLEISGVTIF